MNTAQPRTHKALITGITGQDGSYLAELLLSKGYEVHGIIRRSSSFNTGRIMGIFEDPHVERPRLQLHYGDLVDSSVLNQIIKKMQPDEIYNLAAQSHVRVSFDLPEYTANVVALGTQRLLEAVRDCGVPVRVYQASSSEMFGNTTEFPQKETTPFRPCSPYAIGKVFAFWTAVNYRESYDIFVSNGILFNHESPRRGETFLTRKVTRGIADILAGKTKYIYLGNLDASRDWGWAEDYVELMWRMLQHDQPDDFVIATGESHTVREFVEEAFSCVGLDWREHVRIDPCYYRPTEVHWLQGDYSKAKRVFGWEPKVRFKELVHRMVDADLEASGVRKKVLATGFVKAAYQ